MPLQTLLVVWDLALFVVALAAGFALYFVHGKIARQGQLPLRKRFGRRLMAASVLFLAAAPLDFWKAGVGVLIWVAGMMAVLAWCMVTICHNLDEKDDTQK